jgi:hypothetical protein
MLHFAMPRFQAADYFRRSSPGAIVRSPTLLITLLSLMPARHYFSLMPIIAADAAASCQFSAAFLCRRSRRIFFAAFFQAAAGRRFADEPLSARLSLSFSPTGC